MDNPNRLQHFSVSFFAVVLGMVGFTLSVQRAEQLLGWSTTIGDVLRYGTLALFLIILVIYTAKIFRYPQEVKQEISHPIKINFFPIVAKIFLIFSIIYLTINANASRLFWLLGAGLQLIATFAILTYWIQSKKMETTHLNPAWFIPIVGNIIVPIAGVEHYPLELSWFFFSIGLLMWIALFIIVLNRIIFHHPIAERLLPTLFILFAPPAIGFIAYVKLTGTVDSFAKILYYFALFMFILVVLQFRLFSKIKFYLSWWAYTFPTAAMILATILMYHQSGYVVFKLGSIGLLSVLTVIIIVLSYKTIKRIINKELCVEEN